MPGKTSQSGHGPMLKRMLRHVAHSSFPERDRAMILLSVKAGLRACEIAGLEWSMGLCCKLGAADTIAPCAASIGEVRRPGDAR